MTVECVTNDITILGKTLSEYAFTQDDKGVADITPGKRYTVYGVRKNDFGTFYLVLTDNTNAKLPWWMPAALYRVVDSTIPNKWVSKTESYLGKTFTVTSDPQYFDAEEDIEDGTRKGHAVFAKIRQEPELIDEESTAHDLLTILASPAASANINWGELFGREETLNYIVREFAPKFNYLLEKGVVFSSYDKEMLIDELRAKAMSELQEHIGHGK